MSESFIFKSESFIFKQSLYKWEVWLSRNRRIMQQQSCFFFWKYNIQEEKISKANFLAKSNRIMMIYMHFYVEVTTEITVNLQKA